MEIVGFCGVFIKGDRPRKVPFVKFRPFWSDLARPRGSTDPRQEPIVGWPLRARPESAPLGFMKSIRQNFLRTRGTARLHQIFPTAPALRRGHETEFDALATLSTCRVFSGAEVPWK